VATYPRVIAAHPDAISPDATSSRALRHESRSVSSWSRAHVVVVAMVAVAGAAVAVMVATVVLVRFAVAPPGAVVALVRGAVVFAIGERAPAVPVAVEACDAKVRSPTRRSRTTVVGRRVTTHIHAGDIVCPP